MIRFRLDKFRFDAHYQDLFDQYNKKYFKLRLPQVVVGFYEFNKKDRDNIYGATLSTIGAKYPSYIVLNPVFENWPPTLRMTLLHEMIHVKLLNTGAHGKRFLKELDRLVEARAFNNCL